jgi:TatD DNase family protein
MYIDTHAHLWFDHFKDDLSDVVLRAKEAGVHKIINIGCDEKSSLRSLEMTGEFEGMYASLGLHPYDAEAFSDDLMVEWSALVEENRDKIVAIGETGLDYFKTKLDPEIQKKSFRGQMELAEKLNLPVVVHNREADEDCLSILKERPDVKAVFHCFGSNLEFAEKVWSAGYFTSFTGIVTYKNAEELREVLKVAPADKIMVETDCPYLSPQKYRGERNEPSFLIETVKQMAECKNLSVEELGEQLSKNSNAFFKFS